MPLVTFDVPRVMGKARPRVLKTGRAYTPASTVQAEAAVRNAYMAACAKRYGKVIAAPPHDPVHLTIYTYRPLPHSRPKAMEVEADTYKFDWDNLGKLVSDALNGCAYHDDAQVTRAVVVKHPRRRDQKERTVVTVSWGNEIVFLGELEGMPCPEN